MPALPVETMQLHLAMLNDRHRTDGYLDAIRRGVRDGDVVVDIGTGTGVLATAAAQAGARRVYAIEADAIRRAARRLFACNGVADRIVIVPRLSFRTRLPERADVVVSELIGNEPLAEGVVAITRDAVLRFLKPGGRLIPRTVSLYGVALEIPESALARRCFRAETLERWKDAYGIDFSALASVREPRLFRHLVKPQEMRDWRALTPPIPLAEVWLGARRPAAIRSHRTVVAERGGRLDAIAVYFELNDASGVFLSTHPDQATDVNHWESPVQIVDPPLDLRVGDRIDVAYRYRFRTGLSGCAVSRR
jgi:hypothetical protein